MRGKAWGVLVWNGVARYKPEKVRSPFKREWDIVPGDGAAAPPEPPQLAPRAPGERGRVPGGRGTKPFRREPVDLA